YLKYIGTTMEDFRKNYREQAETNAKYQLVMNKIVEQENITCTDEELDAKIKELAEQSNKSFEEYKANMNPRQKDYIKDMVVTDNMFKFLRDNNKIG
ncbi:MAG: trigger factor, partial [Clostridia bacterium]|nr:trigger factor [Clostridia bacterium]